MKTSSAKAKGRRAAQLTASLLSEYTGLDPGNFMVTPSGMTGPDIIMSPAAKEVVPFVVECKNQEALNIWQSLEQAESHVDMDDPKIPILVFTRNRSPMYCAMEFELLLRLLWDKEENESPS